MFRVKHQITNSQNELNPKIQDNSTLFPWGLVSQGQKALREQIWPCSESGRDVVILTILSITMSLIKHGQVCGRRQTALHCQYEQQIGWLRVSMSLQHSLWGRSGWWPNWRRKRGVWTHWQPGHIHCFSQAFGEPTCPSLNYIINQEVQEDGDKEEEKEEDEEGDEEGEKEYKEHEKEDKEHEKEKTAN